MIIRTLKGEDYEENFKKLNVNQQLRHYRIDKLVDEEGGEFILSVNIDVNKNGICDNTIIKMHYDKHRIMIVDSIINF